MAMEVLAFLGLVKQNQKSPFICVHRRFNFLQTHSEIEFSRC